MDELVLTDDFPMMSIKDIMDHFEEQLKFDDGLELTPQQRCEVIWLLCKHPILRVLCGCLESYGYDNF